ncbi:MAG: DUF2550 domain-containing protein [Actinomycetota bacterium]|nr:DUF2550 domain-containing protein [Actinomycetota bacterium]
MHLIDVLVLCLAALVLVAVALVLARQRFMLRAPGTVPLAIRARNARWQYGVGRYSGAELRWYRSLGLGTRPSRVLERAQLSILNRRPPLDSESSALPSSAVIVECRAGDGDVLLALGAGAYTGFVSWLEASAPIA